MRDVESSTSCPCATSPANRPGVPIAGMPTTISAKPANRSGANRSPQKIALSNATNIGSAPGSKTPICAAGTSLMPAALID